MKILLLWKYFAQLSTKNIIINYKTIGTWSQTIWLIKSTPCIKWYSLWPVLAVKSPACNYIEMYEIDFFFWSCLTVSWFWLADWVSTTTRSWEFLQNTSLECSFNLAGQQLHSLSSLQWKFTLEDDLNKVF
jgi:hypothetical protein